MPVLLRRLAGSRRRRGCCRPSMAGSRGRRTDAVEARAFITPIWLRGWRRSGRVLSASFLIYGRDPYSTNGSFGPSLLRHLVQVDVDPSPSDLPHLRVQEVGVEPFELPLGRKRLFELVGEVWAKNFHPLLWSWNWKVKHWLLSSISRSPKRPPMPCGSGIGSTITMRIARRGLSWILFTEVISWKSTRCLSQTLPERPGLRHSVS